MERMEKGNGGFSLDPIDILSNKTINGNWEITFFGRSTRMFNKGDVITFGFATGGAGYGDPLDRDPELIIQDLKDKIISDWSAENVYKVVYDRQTLKVDTEATKKSRQAEREARIKRGKSYELFSEEWSKLKIDESLLKFYGTWPDAKMVAPIFRP